jgi:hypothetical protein
MPSPQVHPSSSTMNSNLTEEEYKIAQDKNSQLPKWASTEQSGLQGAPATIAASPAAYYQQNSDPLTPPAYTTAVGSDGQIHTVQLASVPAVQQPFFPTQLVPLHTPPLVIDQSLKSSKPDYPGLWYVQNNAVFSLPLADCTIIAHLHVSTAVVHINIVFYNTAQSTIDPIFILPTRGTVTNANININNQRFFETAVISNTDVATLPKKEQKGNEGNNSLFSSVDHYQKDLFRLPVTGVKPGETVYIQVDFIEPLEFFESRYHFTLPLNFPPGCLPQNRNFHDIARIYAYINTPIAVADAGIVSSTHGFTLMNYGSRWDVNIDLANAVGGRTRSFNLSYSIPTTQILGTCIKETTFLHAQTQQEEGNFVLFVSPPSISSIQNYFGRRFVFILDRSGSMSGGPYAEAVTALQNCLNLLGPLDSFTLIVFDHEFSTFQQEFRAADVAWKSSAVEWARRNGPRGGLTNIFGPVKHAVDLIHSQSGHSTGQLVPYIFLFTDGCVQDERDICNYVLTGATDIRMNTLGIGLHCNQYFLQMLSGSSRGSAEIVLESQDISLKTSRLMANNATPILTNLLLNIPGLSNVEIYPNPLPDLYANGPLMISGHYTTAPGSGGFPARIGLVGRDYLGQQVEIPVLTTINPSIPVSKVFIKQRIDILTARQWLTQSKELEAEIVKLSTQQSMPSPFTSMVAYEVDPKKKKQEEEQKNKDKKGTSDKTVMIAAAAVGGVVVLGATLYLMGNLAATAGNVGSFFLTVGSTCCECGQICETVISFVTSCDCGAICDCCGSVFGAVGGGLCDCLHGAVNCIDFDCICKSLCCLVDCIFK